MYKSFLLILTLTICQIVFSGCGSQRQLVQSESVVDQPLVHINTGFDLLDRGDYSGSLDAFDRAVKMEDSNSMALSGKGLMLLFARNDTTGAADLLSQSFSIDKKNPYAFILKGFLNIASDKTGLLLEEHLNKTKDQVQNSIEKALELGDGDERIKYLGAIAFERSLNFEKAKPVFQELSTEGSFISKANDHLSKINKIERLAPTTILGKAIALMDTVSRAEATALISIELKPGKFLKKFEEMILPIDISTHWAKLYLQEVSQTGLIEAAANGLFQPDNDLERVEYALLYMRLMIGFSNDASVARRYVGSEVGYVDLQPSHPGYNAARVTVENGLLNASDGKFNTAGPVSGIEVLEMVSWIRKNFERKF